MGTFLISLYTAAPLYDLHIYLTASTFSSSLSTGQIHTCAGHIHAQVMVPSSGAHHYPAGPGQGWPLHSPPQPRPLMLWAPVWSRAAALHCFSSRSYRTLAPAVFWSSSWREMNWGTNSRAWVLVLSFCFRVTSPEKTETLKACHFEIDPILQLLCEQRLSSGLRKEV